MVQHAIFRSNHCDLQAVDRSVNSRAFTSAGPPGDLHDLQQVRVFLSGVTSVSHESPYHRVVVTRLQSSTYPLNVY